jgi:hypothetical protein
MSGKGFKTLTAISFLMREGYDNKKLECLEKEEKYLDIEKNYSKVKYLKLTFFRHI